MVEPTWHDRFVAAMDSVLDPFSISCHPTGMGPAFNVDTIQKLRNFDIPLQVECRKCGHRALLEASQLMRPKTVHAYVEVTFAARFLKCRCGAKDPLTSLPVDRVAAALWLDGAQPSEACTPPP